VCGKEWPSILNKWINKLIVRKLKGKWFPLKHYSVKVALYSSSLVSFLSVGVLLKYSEHPRSGSEGHFGHFFLSASKGVSSYFHAINYIIARKGAETEPAIKHTTQIISV